MQLAKFWFAVLSLFSLAVAGSVIIKRSDGSDNYATLAKAMGKNAPVVGKKYAVYEYWSGSQDHAWCNGLLNKLGHAALVVGTVKTAADGPEFIATEYEMFKNGDGGSSGSTTGSSVVCKADSTTSHVRENWHRDASHTYSYAGEVTMTADSTSLKNFGINPNSFIWSDK